MRLQVSLPAGHDQAETGSLYRWLGQDPDIGREAELWLESSSAEPGTMGPGLDLINMVLSNSIAAVGALIAAIGLWQSSRPRPPEVRIETVEVVVVLPAGNQRDDGDLAAELARALPAATGWVKPS